MRGCNPVILRRAHWMDRDDPNPTTLGTSSWAGEGRNRAHSPKVSPRVISQTDPPANLLKQEPWKGRPCSHQGMDAQRAGAQKPAARAVGGHTIAYTETRYTGSDSNDSSKAITQGKGWSSLVPQLSGSKPVCETFWNLALSAAVGRFKSNWLFRTQSACLSFRYQRDKLIDQEQQEKVPLANEWNRLQGRNQKSNGLIDMACKLKRERLTERQYQHKPPIVETNKQHICKSKLKWELNVNTKRDNNDTLYALERKNKPKPCRTQNVQ